MDGYDYFLIDTLYPWCWACGRDETHWPKDWHAPWFMQRAHLASGSGKMRRVEDRRQVCILCPRCHLLHSGGLVRIDGGYLPRLTNGNMFHLKSVMDPEYYDEAYLADFWMGAIPSPEVPDDWFNYEYHSRRSPLAQDGSLAKCRP